MMRKEELLSIADKVVNAAMKLGANQAEAFISIEDIKEYHILGETTYGKECVSGGVGIRVAIGKSVGFKSVSSLEEQKVLKAVRKAVKIAKVRKPDPDWGGLTKPRKPSAVEKAFDKRLVDLEWNYLVDSGQLLVDVTKDFDKRVSPSWGTVLALYGKFGIASSEGMDVFDDFTCVSTGYFVNAEEKGEKVGGFDSDASRSLDINWEKIAEGASARAIEVLGGKLIETTKMPVIFENRVFSQLLHATFLPAISAKNAQENRSVYTGKVGQQILGENITILDDGRLPKANATHVIDMEGVPSQRKVVVDKGVVKGLLYDTYTANREQRESTGNASRRRWGEKTFDVPPFISGTNVLLPTSNRSLDNLISEVSHGLLVKEATGISVGSNPVTGGFSISATSAFLVQNGEIKRPVKGCMIAGNIHEVLKNIVEFGKDVKRGLWPNILAPSVIVKELTVAGK